MRDVTRVSSAFHARLMRVAELTLVWITAPSEQDADPVTLPSTFFVRRGPTSAAFVLAILFPLVALSASAPPVDSTAHPILIVARTTPTGTDGIQLSVGVAADDGNPSTCGSAVALAVRVGDPVNFCYTVTNASASTLRYHTLVDSADGTIFTLMPQDVAPGASIQFNRITAARADASTYVATWTAQDLAPGYAAQPATPP
jgi:hypothetical protein